VPRPEFAARPAAPSAIPAVSAPAPNPPAPKKLPTDSPHE
jgi:hypothetical protein